MEGVRASWRYLIAVLTRAYWTAPSLATLRPSFKWHVKSYCRYIEWVKSEWPAGGPEAGLVTLLERATKSLVGVPSMAGNVEYVKLWITYVSTMRHQIVVSLPITKLGRSHAKSLATYSASEMLLQADSLGDPSDVFKYMHTQRIGADCALFYMAWAWLAEHRGT